MKIWRKWMSFGGGATKQSAGGFIWEMMVGNAYALKSGKSAI